MSQAFVKESDDQWLQDVSPSVNALTNFLTRENNGVRVYVQKVENDDAGREIYFFSNGLKYTKDHNSAWTTVE
jgi:hypothetical protein